MQKSFARLILLLILLDNSGLTSAKKDYKGSSVLRVNIQGETQMRKFKDLSKTFGYEVDEWGPTDIFVRNKDTLIVVKAKLKQHELSYRILIENVGRLIHDVDEKNQNIQNRSRHRRSVSGPRGDEQPLSLLPDSVVGRYATFKEITNWLHEIQEPAKPMVKMFSLGKTYHNNDLYLIKIGKPSNFTKPAVWLDFGAHPREWISISTGTYVIYHLLNEYLAKRSDTVELLNKADFYMMPVANPDGYIYTHEEDRMWRKNRVPAYGSSGCSGTDLNRNFPYHWGEARASCYQCDTQYRGPFPHSENESQAMSAAIQALKKSIKVYITVHSYSQMWLTRWGYSTDETDDFDEQIYLAKKAVKAIYDTTRTNYTVGSSANSLYRFSGGAADWAKGSVGIKYSFGVELRDKGDYGFILPADQINGTGAEFLAALKVVTEHIIQETRNDPYFNKPKLGQDTDSVVLENILRRNKKKEIPS